MPNSRRLAFRKTRSRTRRTLPTGMVSYVGGKYLSKDGNKGKIRAQVKRVATDKLTENGKPYFNNYFNDDKLGEASADEAPADEKKDAKSPYLKD